jgi:hypothetical protein
MKILFQSFSKGSKVDDKKMIFLEYYITYLPFLVTNILSQETIN